jgi:integrase
MSVTVSAKKGEVAILDKEGRLQLRLRYQRRLYWLSLGLPASKANLRIAQDRKQLIESDIRYDRFDPTLKKYRLTATLEPAAIVEPQQPQPLCLMEVWQAYTRFRTPQVSPSTIKRDYAKIEKRIAKMPLCYTFTEVRDWLLSHYSAEITRRTLLQLHASFKWAVDSSLINENPFTGKVGQIKRKRSRSSPQAFTPREIAAILEAFRSDRFTPASSGTRHSFYAAFVEFLALSGCRPEEAVALQWKHISAGFEEIRIERARPSDTGLIGSTKTGTSRSFAVNTALGTLLQSIKPRAAAPSELIFPSPHQRFINTYNFCQRVWRPVLHGLVEAGEVRQYLTPYALRRTCFTEMRRSLPDQDCAAIAGHSPVVFYQSYAAVSQNLVLPEVQ